MLVYGGTCGGASAGAASLTLVLVQVLRVRRGPALQGRLGEAHGGGPQRQALRLPHAGPGPALPQHARPGGPRYLEPRYLGPPRPRHLGPPRPRQLGPPRPRYLRPLRPIGQVMVSRSSIRGPVSNLDIPVKL